jgi:hypothetical protein
MRLQLNDGRASDGGLPGARGLDVGWAARALGVEAVQSEVFIVTATHGGIEALDRGSLVAQTAGLAGRDLSSVELAFGRGVEDEQFGGFSRARERGVGAVAGEVLASSDDARPLHDGALEAMAAARRGVQHCLQCQP